MTIDINKFLNFNQLRNGKTKITFSSQNETNVYILLRELGFCKSNLDGKRIYYQRIENKITPVSLRFINDVFFDFFQKEKYTNISSVITHSDIINWFLKYQIRKNEKLDYFLKDTLTEKEAESFHIQTNESFKHKFEIQQLISKLNEWNFRKTTNYVRSFGKNNPIYYKNIGNKEFLVFNHYNSIQNNNDGFDSWIATFENENEIGVKRPTEIKNIRLSFHLEKDFNLIRYLIN